MKQKKTLVYNCPQGEKIPTLCGVFVFFSFLVNNFTESGPRGLYTISMIVTVVIQLLYGALTYSVLLCGLVTYYMVRFVETSEDISPYATFQLADPNNTLLHSFMYTEQAMTEGCASPPPPGVSTGGLFLTRPQFTYP